MIYAPLPRPVTTPDMRERARALLGAAQRKQDLFGQALVQAESKGPDASRSSFAPGSSALGVPPTAVTPASKLEHMVRHITQACDEDLVHTHQRLAQARSSAERLAAADTELHAFMAAAYGQAPVSQAGGQEGSQPVVIDVEAREVAPEASAQKPNATQTATEPKVPTQ